MHRVLCAISSVPFRRAFVAENLISTGCRSNLSSLLSSGLSVRALIRSRHPRGGCSTSVSSGSPRRAREACIIQVTDWPESPVHLPFRFTVYTRLVAWKPPSLPLDPGAHPGSQRCFLRAEEDAEVLWFQAVADEPLGPGGGPTPGSEGGSASSRAAELPLAVFRKPR